MCRASIHLPLNRIAAAPGFPGLRRFPEGRNFKQWTGNDSKALMKVSICNVLSISRLLIYHYRCISLPSKATSLRICCVASQRIWTSAILQDDQPTPPKHSHKCGTPWLGFIPIVRSSRTWEFDPMGSRYRGSMPSITTSRVSNALAHLTACARR